MGQIILGTGKYAEKPYFIDKFYINVYSVEELCYILVEKAQMLDPEIMQRDLVQWLDEQCGLNQLAHALYSLLNQNGSFCGDHTGICKSVSGGCGGEG